MRSRWVAIGVLLVAAACTEAKPGKQTAGDSAPAHSLVAMQTLRIDVSNTLATPMTVSALAGGQTQALGNVKAQQHGRFTVQVPANANVQIMANDEGNKRRVQATLMGGDTLLHYVIR